MTAKEFLKEQHINSGIENAMIGFAKMHVKLALEVAGEIVENELEKDFLNKKSILEAYPLDLIK
jgi:hypothetical protein